MKKSTLIIVTGTATILLSLFLDALVFPGDVPIHEWGIPAWTLMTAEVLLLIAGIVMIVLGCKQKKRENR